MGQGVSGLCCATEGQSWIFSGYSLTGVSFFKSLYRYLCDLFGSNNKICLCWKPSVFELVRRPDFANLPLIVEDFVRDSGGSYTGELTCTALILMVSTSTVFLNLFFFFFFAASPEDAVHVVIDRHLITGQNTQSTSLAVNNLILLCNTK